ncbi:hypothetical protein GCM10009738_49240 [Kitasatospora viridis]
MRIVEHPAAQGQAVLSLDGALDVRSAADARAVLHQAVDRGTGDLVLDLAALRAWDATGLGVIMGTHRRAGRLGRRLVLRAVPAQLQRLLVATRLHRILAVEGAEADQSADFVRGHGHGTTLPGLAGLPGAAALPSLSGPA